MNTYKEYNLKTLKFILVSILGPPFKIRKLYQNITIFESGRAISTNCDINC